MNAKFSREQAHRLRKLREEVAVLEASQGAAMLELEQALTAAGLGALNSAPMPPRAAGDTNIPQWVIKAASYADTLRDALAPFDSGVREEAEPKPVIPAPAAPPAHWGHFVDDDIRKGGL